jgi:N-acetylglucosaminyl-diphospho-decaprenol L-rhamnosyltransferase
VDRDPIREYGDELAVVTVTRSTTVTLDRFLGSLRAATARPVRVVVADTAGVEAVPGTDMLRIAEDVGRAAAANRAVAALDGAVGWVVLADPQVQWGAGALDVLLDVAARHPRAGVLGPRLCEPGGRVVPSGGAVPSIAAALRGRIPTGAAAGPTGWLTASCVLMRRAAWDSVDGFDPRYLGGCGPVEMADVDLGDRLGRAGWLAVHVPAAEVTVHAPGGHGILEGHGDGLRRYVHDRGSAPVRALLALAGRGRGT